MADESTPVASFEAQINVKMSRDLKERLRRIEARHGTPVSEILRRLGAAAVVFFEENGYLTFPAAIVPETFSPPAANKGGKGQKAGIPSSSQRKRK